MRNKTREFGAGMQEGKFLEGALLGQTRVQKTGLPIREAMKDGKLIPLLKKNLKALMQQTREGQMDDPTYPKRPFMKKLLNDVEDEIARRFDLPGSYEVRVYSAVGTALDLGGIDFWIELYDSETDKIISDFKIDLKSNPHGRMGRMADYLYYCDDKIASSEDRKAIFEAPDYKDLVNSSALHLLTGVKADYVRENRDRYSELQL